MQKIPVITKITDWQHQMGGWNNEKYFSDFRKHFQGMISYGNAQ